MLCKRETFLLFPGIERPIIVLTIVSKLTEIFPTLPSESTLAISIKFAGSVRSVYYIDPETALQQSRKPIFKARLVFSHERSRGSTPRGKS